MIEVEPNEDEEIQEKIEDDDKKVDVDPGIRTNLGEDPAVMMTIM